MIQTPPTRLVLATAADGRYARLLINMISSLQHHSPSVEQIYVYDLGLSPWQRLVIGSLEKVTLRRVPLFVPHALQCWTWKPWVWQDVPAERVLFIDAGFEAVGDLAEIGSKIDEDGYFVVSQYEALKEGHPLRDSLPPDYYDQFDFSHDFDDRPPVGTGLVGYRKGSPFFREVLQKTLTAAEKGFTLGWSESELHRNIGINRLEPPIIRDCKFFRHEQTLLNIYLYQWDHNPVIQPMARYAALQPSPEALLINERFESRLSWLSQLVLKPHLRPLRSVLLARPTEGVVNRASGAARLLLRRDWRGIGVRLKGRGRIE